MTSRRYLFNVVSTILVVGVAVLFLPPLPQTDARHDDALLSRQASTAGQAPLDGSLLIVLNEQLYRVELASGAASLLTEGLAGQYVTVSPDQTFALYTVRRAEDDGRAVLLHNLDNSEAFEVYRTAGQAFDFAWTADGRYVSFIGIVPVEAQENGLRVGIIDVMARQTMTYNMPHQTTAWLTDNTLLVIRLDMESAESDLLRILPEYDDWDELGPANTALVNGLTQPDGWLSGQGIIENMGFDLAPPLAANASGWLGVAPDSSGLVMLKPVDPTAEQPACGNLRVWKHPLLEVFTPEIVIEAGDEVQNIGALTLTSEGDIFFVIDNTEACGASETESLLMYRPSGESVAVIGNVPVVDGYRSGRPYTLSPDERYLIWLPAGSEGEALMLRVWDREENTTFDMTVDGLAMPDEAAQVSLVDWIE